MVAGKTLKDAEGVFIALLTIGLIGLLFLIIYGNLSGNLGFSDVGLTTINETGVWLNQTPYTVLRASDSNFTGGFSVIALWNGTIDETPGGYNVSIPLANATAFAGNGSFVASDFLYNSTNVSVSYTASYRSIPETNTESVIGNLTTGATQFFSFSNVWFILTAVTVLIGIVLGVIVMVRRVSGGGEGKSKFQGSSFTT